MPFDIDDVTVLWDRQPLRVEADAANSTPLVGIRLLDSHNLNIDVENGGRVVIQVKDYSGSRLSTHFAAACSIGCQCVEQGPVSHLMSGQRPMGQGN